MSHIGLAITELYSGVGAVIPEGATYDDIIWDDPNDPNLPSKEAVEAKIAEIVAELPLKHLRVVRDRLLEETDVWVLQDRTPTQAQLDYRQALRDITETYTSLDDVVWPTKPENL